jgi:aminopeptidase N
MHHDGDLFNRWQASNTYATRAMLSVLRAKTKSAMTQKALKLAEALRSALRDTALDDAYKAELLKLPSVTDIAREKAVKVDHAAIYDVHKAFTRTIADTLIDELHEIYAHTSNGATYSPDALSAGRRALRNVALSLLTARHTKDDYTRLEGHYHQAANMTDAAHALYLVASVNTPGRASILADFFER